MSEEDAIDPEEIQRLEFEVRGRQRLLLGAVAGAIAAAVGAAVWAGIVYYAQMEIAWIAIGIGFLVGFAVRTAGRGVTPKFGILGALLVRQAKPGPSSWMKGASHVIACSTCSCGQSRRGDPKWGSMAGLVAVVHHGAIGGGPPGQRRRGPQRK